MNKSKLSVLLGMQLLGATNAPESAYSNVKDGKEAWDAVVAEGLVAKTNGFWSLTPAFDLWIERVREQEVKVQ